MLSVRVTVLTASLVLAGGWARGQQPWQPSTDWAHWRLGHKPDLAFLQRNRLTITFGSGAPNFEQVSREQFNAEMAKAKASNHDFHDKGYIVLRYLSSSLNGESDSPEAEPRADQIRWLGLYRQGWDAFADYIGPRPAADPTTWITRRHDGTFPFYRYAPYGQKTGRGFETWGCPNNPDYVRVMEGKVRAQAETGIDGSYIDWTQIASNTCYCEYCRAKFRAWLTQHLPKEAARTKYGVSEYARATPPTKRGEPFWMEWITFRGASVAELHRHLREVARRYNPTFMISGNVFGGFGFGPIAYDAAGNIEMLGRDGYDDFVYSEIQEFLDTAPRKNAEGVKITNSPALKFISAATHGKPVVVYATEITPPIFPNPTEKCLSAMAQINIAEAVANHTVFREKRETPPGATAIYNFLADNEPHMATAQLSSSIAVVASLNQYLADELSFAFSTSRVLADRGVAHVLIVEDDLTARALDKYAVIVLPYLPLLSAAKQQALVRYVERGGSVVLLGRSGVKDQYNVPMKTPPLAGLAGGTGYPEAAAARREKRGRVEFVPLPIPSTKYLIPMKARGEYTTFGPTMADVFPDIPEGYTRNRIDPALRRVLETVASKAIELAAPQLTRLTEPSPYLEINSMTTSDAERMLIHLVNYNVTIDGDVTPAQGVTVELAPPSGKKVRSIRYSGTLSPLQPVKFAPVGKAIRFTADRLDIYGLAVVELE